MHKCIWLIAATMLAGCTSKQPFTVAWHKSRLDGYFGSSSKNSLKAASPAVSGDRLFISTLDGKVMSFDRTKGELIWKNPLKELVEGVPLAHNGRIYFGSLDGIVRALSQESGEVIWSADAGAEVLARPTAWNELILVATTENRVIAFKADDGELVWDYRRDRPSRVSLRGTSGVTVVDDKALVGFSDGMLVCLTAIDGIPYWSQQIGDQGRFTDVDSTPIIAGENLIAAAAGGPLVTFDHEGRKVWQQPKIGTTASVAMTEEAVYAASNTSHVYRLNRQTGEVVWKTFFGNGAPLTPVVIDPYLVLPLSDSRMLVFEKKSGKRLWTYRMAEPIAGELWPIDGGFYALTGDQILYSFTLNRTRL